MLREARKDKAARHLELYLARRFYKVALMDAAVLNDFAMNFRI